MTDKKLWYLEVGAKPGRAVALLTGTPSATWTSRDDKLKSNDSDMPIAGS